MYKAVFIDIDKTLLNSNGEVSNQTKNAIENVKNNGIKVFIISGRSRMSAINFKEYSDTYMINSNGADIYDYEKNEVLYQSIIDGKFCKELYNIAENKNMVIKLDFGLSRAVNNPDFLESYELELTENIEDFLQQNNVIQIAMCSEKIEDIENLKKYIEEKTDLVVTNQFIWNVNQKEMHSVHINNKNVSKGNAMIGLCKFLKIDLKDTVAIGDKTNDISMIKSAGFGVAMGNAIEEVKNIADFISTTNDENGVTIVLEKILKENEKKLKNV